MIKHALRSLWQAIKAWMFVLKTVVAVPTVITYPLTALMGFFIFLAAFEGGPLELLFWVMIFAAFTVLLLIATFIKRKGASLGTAIFVICCQLIIMVVVCNMAFGRLFQVWINFWTLIVCFAVVCSQLSLWWLRRHYAEVWNGLKTWSAKLFTRRAPAAAHHVGVAALGTTPAPTTPVAGTFGPPPPPTP